MTYTPPSTVSTTTKRAVPVTGDWSPAGGTIHVATTADVLALATLAVGETATVSELEIIPDTGNTGDIITDFPDGSSFTLLNGSLTQAFSVEGLEPSNLTDFTVTGIDGDGFRLTAMLLVN